MSPAFQTRMFLFIALATCYLACCIRAFPIPTINRRYTPSSCNDLHYCRTIWNIIWSSLATIFACIWAAVHPNIPRSGPNTSSRIISWLQSYDLLLHRVTLMVMALIVPELIVIWAMRQWLAARRIAKDYECTMTQGFFSLMGGVVYEGRGGEHTFYPDLHVFFSDDDKEHFKTNFKKFTDKDIQDKSKSGVLLKGYAALQTGWFILQCIARWVERLPLTELEITTVAFATLNFAVYMLWLYKPLAVECPHRVHASCTWKNDDDEPPQRVLWSDVWAYIKLAARDPRAGVREFPVIVGKAQRSVVDDAGKFLKIHYPGILQKFRPIAGPIVQMIGLPWPGDRPQNRGDYNFYAGEGPDNELIYVAPAAGVVAVIFGGIHCIAWRFQFPSQIEQTLWRICAAIIICTPLFYVLLGALVLTIYLSPLMQSPDPQGHLHGILMFLYIFVIALPGVLYFLARMTLLVLTVISLRSLPPGAFQTVSWTTFIPHI